MHRHAIPILPETLDGVDELSSDVFRTFMATMRQHGRLMMQEMRDHGLHHGQAMCLRLLSANDGITQRDLCSLEVLRDVAPGVKLASFRSVDALPPEPGHERIDWWGAALCRTRDDGVTSELTYLDFSAPR